MKRQTGRQKLDCLYWKGRGKVCFGVHTCTYQAIWIRLLSCPFRIWFDSHAFVVSAVHRFSLLQYLCH